MLKIALSNKIHDNKSTRKKMESIWQILSNHMELAYLPIPLTFLPVNSNDEFDFLVASKEGPYILPIPPLAVSGIIRDYRGNVLSIEVKLNILGIIFQEMAKRMIRMEYLKNAIPQGMDIEIQGQAISEIWSSTDAEVAAVTQDEGRPVKVIKDKTGSKATIIFMYSRYKNTLLARGFFEKLTQQGWRYC